MKPNTQHKRETATIVAGSVLFLQALRDDSNQELDWLWLAHQNVSDRERIYALRRALFINPGNEFAQRALTHLIRSTNSVSAALRSNCTELQHT